MSGFGSAVISDHARTAMARREIMEGAGARRAADAAGRGPW
jgi:hypothetical protein